MSRPHAGQPPAQPGPYPAPRHRSPLPWALGGLGFAALVAVVLVLVFVVFAGPSGAEVAAAEEVARNFLASWEDKDADLLVSTFDPSFRAELESALGEYYDLFFEHFFESVPDDLVIDIRKMDTRIDGDSAEVEFADGTMTYTDEDGDKVSEEAPETDMSYVRLQKVDGEWYLTADFLKEIGFDLDELASLMDLLISMQDWETVEDTVKVDVILPIDSEEEAFSALLEMPELSSWFWGTPYAFYTVTEEDTRYVFYLFNQPYGGDQTLYGWFGVDKQTGEVYQITNE